jgi:hypothetical protein
MGPVGCPETLVTNYQSTLRKISEERICSLSLSVLHALFFTYLLPLAPSFAIITMDGYKYSEYKFKPVNKIQEFPTLRVENGRLKLHEMVMT